MNSKLHTRVVGVLALRDFVVVNSILKRDNDLVIL